MRKINWSYPFFVVFISDLVAVYLGNETLRYITKPLLMPLLILLFISLTNSKAETLKKLIVLALFFSWLGDVLLMFEAKNGNFFIFGLVSFLIAHIFYILFFERIIVLDGLKKSYWVFLPVMIYYVVLISVLSPTLGDMDWPVRIYGIVISYMLIKASQAGWVKNKQVVLFLLSGAILFVISDSILALNKFYKPLEYAGLFIMITYGSAQFMLVKGAARYIVNSSKL